MTLTNLRKISRIATLGRYARTQHRERLQHAVCIFTEQLFITDPELNILKVKLKQFVMMLIRAHEQSSYEK